jgi:hypothetical protein
MTAYRPTMFAMKKMHRTSRFVFRGTKMEGGSTSCIRLVTALLALLFPAAGICRETIKISVYRLLETDACGPAGYQKDSKTCPVAMTANRFRQLLDDEKLSLVMQDTVVPPSAIKMPRTQLVSVLRYSEISGGLALPRAHDVRFQQG